MATKKPRITVTLTEHQHRVLKSISESGGQSMSVFVSGLIGSALPTLERMANAFQKLKEAQDSERDKMIKVMDESFSILEPVVAEAVDQYHLFLGAIEQNEGAESPADALCASAEPSAPDLHASPRTNRGATHNPKNRRKPSGTTVSTSS